jgi:hypothetical protein
MLLLHDSHISLKLFSTHHCIVPKNNERVGVMMPNKTFQIEEEKQFRKKEQRVFQAVFLKNNNSQEVKVVEDEQIDFMKVQEHLKSGGSVFITSKNSQKLKLRMPKGSRNQRKNRSKMNMFATVFVDHL